MEEAATGTDPYAAGLAVTLGPAHPASEYARSKAAPERKAVTDVLQPSSRIGSWEHLAARRRTADLSRRVGSMLGMTRSPSDFRRAEAAWSASRRMIARKERPCYRVAETGDGATVHIIELPWIRPIDASRQNALDRARDAIAAWLDVQPDSFDVERG